VENPPVASFTTNPTIFTEPSQVVTFSNNTVGASTYIWEFGDGQSSTEENPVHFFNNIQGIIPVLLTAISSYGCTDFYYMNLVFREELNLYIPNTFTPDDNEVNQIFTAVTSNPELVEEFEMSIFNRWGELVFQSFDIQIGWDGSFDDSIKSVEDGTYTYIVKYRFTSDIRRRLVGHVNVLR
jgi:gliding motility-associated-like protein